VTAVSFQLSAFEKMIAATGHEMMSSLAAYHELRCEPRRLSFAETGTKTITVDLRGKEPHQLVHLARLVANLGYEETDFRGAHLWLTTWGVWNPQVEAIGFKMLEQFRRGYGENRSLESAPGHLFRDDEFTEAVCCLLPPVMVGWDGYYVPHWAYGRLDYFVSFSHDSFLDVHFRTEEMYDRARQILTSYEWIEQLLKADS
jgi:hypothetical protein